jgi:endonuclease G
MNVAQCLARYQAVPMPFERGDDANSSQTIVCRRGYLLSYDAATHDPDWVMELLTPLEVNGKAARADKFTQDKLLAGIDAQEADYKAADAAGNRYDRGHQAPAGDAKFDQTVMDQSFFFSNMAPQVGIGFNRGVWKFLEESVRAWVACGGHSKLFVFTGPIYATGARAPTLGTDKVAIPTAFFKIVYDPQSDRSVGFVLPNVKIGSTIPDLQKYVKPIAEIETETGLDFFRSFDQRHQQLLETNAGTSWGHIQSCQAQMVD